MKIRGTRPVLLAAVDKPVGKEPERELVAGSRPLRAGVVEDQEAVAQTGDAGGHDPRIDRDPLPAVAIRGEASAMRQIVPPLPRITWQRSPPPIDQGRSGCRRWRNVAPPA